MVVSLKPIVGRSPFYHLLFISAAVDEKKSVDRIIPLAASRAQNLYCLLKK
jgi:hypothetical protein